MQVVQRLADKGELAVPWLDRELLVAAMRAHCGREGGSPILSEFSVMGSEEEHWTETAWLQVLVRQRNDWMGGRGW